MGLMMIETESTPNPATVKFLPGQEVMTAGTRDFTNPEEAEISPLAAALFSSGSPLFRTGSAGDIAISEDSFDDDPADADVVAQIRELIETRVRPAVEQDGGDIVYRGFRDGTVFLAMQGACSGCPSSSMTLKQGIEGLLKHYVPEVEAVEAV